VPLRREPPPRHITTQNLRKALSGRYSERPPRPEEVVVARTPSSPPPPVLALPQRIVEGARDWLSSGSLELPDALSARHARALQRGMLLALLQTPGLASLPDGIAQRARWMFRDGWADGASSRELEDLLTLLRREVNETEKALLLRTVRRCLG